MALCVTLDPSPASHHLLLIWIRRQSGAAHETRERERTINGGASGKLYSQLTQNKTNPYKHYTYMHTHKTQAHETLIICE